MQNWLLGFISATLLAVLGFLVWRFQRFIEKKDEKQEAVAALRFELESNILWLDDGLESLNYLRDEAWLVLKNKGYISYLPNPIPMEVIKTYDKLHRLNHHLHILKHPDKYKEGTFNKEKAIEDQDILEEYILKLIKLLDNYNKKIGRNFK